MEAGPSTRISPIEGDAERPAVKRINLHIPTNFLIIPPCAAALGLFIGISRGGSRARLGFLAENAHRTPKTIQGWYFYTKTRNYRVLFASAKSGAKYALGLGGASAAFVALEESAGVVREQLIGVEGFPEVDAAVEQAVREKRRLGWREGQAVWSDGAVAGSVMGTAVGAMARLPRPLFVRALVMGAIMGTFFSALQRLQDQLRQSIAIEESRQASLVPAQLTTIQSEPMLPSQPAAAPSGLSTTPGAFTSSAALPNLHGEESHSDLLPVISQPGRPWYDPRGWVGQ